MACFPHFVPKPPREWSRVQNRCVFDTEPITPEQALLVAMQYKGNILQYKKNSSCLTFSQKYSLISQNKWTNNKKTYATQSDRYSNPNTNHLRRINSTDITLDNSPTPLLPTCKEPVAPIYDNLPNKSDNNNNNTVLPPPPPTTTDSNFTKLKKIIPLLPEVIQNGGILLCNETENICTKEIIRTPQHDNCYSTTFSDVPRGDINYLCYIPRPLYYPRQRYFMNNSTDKWPYNSKAIIPYTIPKGIIVIK